MKGPIEACCLAEQEIMKKVREAYDNDIAAMNVSPPRSTHTPSTRLVHTHTLHTCLVQTQTHTDTAVLFTCIFFPATDSPDPRPESGSSRFVPALLLHGPAPTWKLRLRRPLRILRGKSSSQGSSLSAQVETWCSYAVVMFTRWGVRV